MVKNKSKRIKKIHLLLIILILLGIILLAWSIHDTMTLKQERWELYYPKLPESLEGKTIVQLSDLHLESLRITPDRIKKLITPKPDILVITGDVISTRTDLDKLTDYLGSLDANDGKYIVMGNNDYSHFSHTLFEKYLSMLRNMGWTPLLNEAEYLKSLQLWIIGIDDPATAHDNVDKAYSMVDVDNSSNSTKPFRLVLAHSTDCLDGVAQYGADLLLTGHTHGGQIRLPGFKPLVTNTYLGDKGIFEGYHVIDGVPLYINRGIGESVLPLRLNVLPEISFFTLHRGDKQAQHITN